MRTKTIKELCQDAVKYAIKTLDIERHMVLRFQRAETQAEAQLCVDFDIDIKKQSNSFKARWLTLRRKVDGTNS